MKTFTLRRIFGSLVMLSHLPGQARVPYLPKEKTLKLRDARVRKIAKYAAETVPYYRDYFRDTELSYRDIRTADDLRLLPIIDKNLVRQDPKRFVSTSRRGRNSIRFVTSGSTGEPLEVWHDRRSLLAQAAYGARERGVIKDLLGKEFDYNEILILYTTSTLKKIWGFYRDSAFTPIKANRLVVPITETPEKVIQIINERQPDVVASYGSYLDQLFRIIADRNIKIHRPRLIRFGADGLPSSGRDLIEKKYGIPVISNYGTVECFKIGFECGKGRHYHIQEDLCHLRTITPDGKETSPGEKGEVVISNLVTYGTVLLNYRTGDLATISPGPCDCGRTNSLLSELEGRIEDTVILEDGDFVHPRAIWSVFKSEPAVFQFQLVQHTFSTFELLLVTKDRAVFDRVLPRILRSLHKLLGDQAKIECEHSQTTLRPESGKFRCVRSRCSKG